MLPATILFATHARLLIWPAIGFAAGVYCFYKGLRHLRRKRLILRTPASKIRDAAMGLVEISGRATSPYIMNSPLKRAACYYYRTTVWEWKEQGKAGVWAKAAEETLHVPFYLDDNTEKVLIDPRGAEIELQCDLQEEYNCSGRARREDIPQQVGQFLMRHGIDRANQRIKVEEYCIKPRTFLFVLGTLSQNPGIDATVMPAWAERAGAAKASREACELESSVPEVIRLSTDTAAGPVTEMTQQQKIAAALMKAGIGNPAWTPTKVEKKAPPPMNSSPVASAVAAPAIEQVEPVDARGFDLHPPVVLMKGAREPAFFISWRSPRDAMKSMGWKSRLMIWGGAVLAIFCLHVFLARFA